ncbi:MAG: hypothetical protein SGARI_007728, partial [Bacillariaceae sp.]
DPADHYQLTILPHVSRNFRVEILPPHLRNYEEGRLQAMRFFQNWPTNLLPVYSDDYEITRLPGYKLAEATRVQVFDSWKLIIVKTPGAAQELSVGYVPVEDLGVGSVPKEKVDAVPIFPSDFQVYSNSEMILSRCAIIDDADDANHKRQRVS